MSKEYIDGIPNNEDAEGQTEDYATKGQVQTQGHGTRAVQGQEVVMPFTKKGKKIMATMKKEYGAEKAKEVFYASANKGTIKGVHKTKK